MNPLSIKPIDAALLTNHSPISFALVHSIKPKVFLKVLPTFHSKEARYLFERILRIAEKASTDHQFF